MVWQDFIVATKSLIERQFPILMGATFLRSLGAKNFVVFRKRKILVRSKCLLPCHTVYASES